ncbi:MAG: hypothetical protein HC897_11720 [Thermoanaerobaculia bacterium]|nr:hypothetical protein [Thermoanaerobaculia bacterium]
MTAFSDFSGPELRVGPSVPPSKVEKFINLVFAKRPVLRPLLEEAGKIEFIQDHVVIHPKPEARWLYDALRQPPNDRIISVVVKEVFGKEADWYLMES